MMRCFSFWARSHDGHLYVTSSYWKLYCSAKCGMNSYNQRQQFSNATNQLPPYQERRRQEVLDEPELDSLVGVAQHAEDHD